ncbi:MAG TPA: IS21 family transposase [Candidatus Polarisedimenticolia bacterium]|nr:IS21 family transposase [Candidatus Polarisedimenticolia bacterium]
MSTEIDHHTATIGPEVIPPEEVPMVRQERWEELRRLWQQERVPIAELARRFELDRKTVRRCLQDTTWRPYQRPAPAETLLTPHAEYLQARAPKVRYSAQVLFQELRQQGYRGGYDTVRRFVRPLRTARLLAEGTVTRFETPPGAQSQIDWGTATVPFRQQPRVRHVFVLTLGFSRRSFYQISPNETLPQFLDAHERAFEHFGGRTREHLYDRPRTVCQGTEQGRIIWNPTFRAFADYWGFEPRLCRPYRAQTKGKVESGVKYFKGNFLAGREFVDDLDLHEQLLEWMATVADVRIHGTTHERPLDRFTQERAVLVPTRGQPSFRLEAPLARLVADDWLVSVDTNRYSVPFTLVGQAVEVHRRNGRLQILHRGTLVAEHAESVGRHQLRILPEHGPGASARTARQRHSTPPARRATASPPVVEVRDLAVYDALLGDTEIAAPLTIVAPGAAGGLDRTPAEVSA